LAGIYLHIPFCKQACYYCNFHFSTTLHLKTKLIDSIVKEIALQQNFFEDSQPSPIIETIYFGGGTPSLLTEAEIGKLLNQLHQHFIISPNAEITLEANPDDINAEKLKALFNLGINRLSIGIQSLNDEHLQYMNRSHTAQEAIQCISDSLNMGFKQLNIDMIFGLPGLSTAHWEQQLKQISDFPVEHLSAYALTVEPKTALAKMLSKGNGKPLDDALTAEQFLLTSSILESFGYEHYELSNYARNQQYAKHNTAYWQNKPYLGVGPSAHSYFQHQRSWNIANNAMYIKNMEAGKPFSESENLTLKDRYNEYLMTGLRTQWGVNLPTIAQQFGKEYASHLKQSLTEINPTFYSQTDNQIQLTKQGWLWCDAILEQMFCL
jgi:oxygen-independent coproporphyrinogen-3 oxidase